MLRLKTRLSSLLKIAEFNQISGKTFRIYYGAASFIVGVVILLAEAGGPDYNFIVLINTRKVV